MVPEKKLILMVLLFLVMAAILDSCLTQIRNSETLEFDHTSSEIWQQLPQWFQKKKLFEVV